MASLSDDRNQRTPNLTVASNINAQQSRNLFHDRPRLSHCNASPRIALGC
jgi:hypothetical protein